MATSKDTIGSWPPLCLQLMFLSFVKFIISFWTVSWPNNGTIQVVIYNNVIVQSYKVQPFSLRLKWILRSFNCCLFWITLLVYKRFHSQFSRMFDQFSLFVIKTHLIFLTELVCSIISPTISCLGSHTIIRSTYLYCEGGLTLDPYWI